MAEEEAQRAATGEGPTARRPSSTDAKAALLTGGLVILPPIGAASRIESMVGGGGRASGDLT